MLKPGDVFELKDLIEVPETGVNRVIFYKNENTRVVLHALNAGQEIQPHPAPGNALVFALEGKAIMNYEGVDHEMKAGDSMLFGPGGMHGVKAIEPYKFVVFLSLS